MTRSSSTAELVHEREQLEEMLQSDGWRIFVRRCADEWRGDGFHKRIGVAVNSGDAFAPKVAYAVSLEIERMLQWPVDRVKSLKGHTE